MSASLYSSEDGQVADAAEAIGVSFGDETAFRKIRQRVSGGQLNRDELQKSLRMLSSDSSPGNLPLYLQLLSNRDAVAQVIPLEPFDQPQSREVALAIRRRRTRRLGGRQQTLRHVVADGPRRDIRKAGEVAQAVGVVGHG